MKKWRPLDGKQIVYGYPSDSASIMARLIGQLDERMAELFPGEDEPDYPEATVAQFFKPEPAPEDPPDYSCPVCGEDTLDSSGKCQCGVWSSLAAANRKIAQLARERDEAQCEARLHAENSRFYESQLDPSRAQARAQAIQDTKNAAVKALEEEFYDWAVGGTQIAAAAVRIMLNLELK